MDKYSFSSEAYKRSVLRPDVVQRRADYHISQHHQPEQRPFVLYLDTTLEHSMQGSFSPQATQASPGEEKAGTHTVPLQKLFEQLESSEQGLTNEEARKRLETYGSNDITGLLFRLI